MDFLARQFHRYPRLYSLLVVAAAFAALYLSTNHLSAFPARYLPLFDFENKIPFIPWTVVIYLSTFPQVAAAILLVRRNDLEKTTAAVVKIILLLSVFFLFYPTTYPRPDLPPSTPPVSRLFYNLLTSVDTPKNCFPSLHVTMSVFLAFVVRRRHRCLGLLFLAWAGAIIISTLTLKQHYMLDALSGVFLAVIFYHYFFRRKK